jgi:hypothetical protein
MLRLAPIEINPDASIEPRSEFLARLRREDRARVAADVAVELASIGADPVPCTGGYLAVIAGRQVFIGLDGPPPRDAYTVWLSGLEDRERPVRAAYRRLSAAEGE